MKRVLQFVCVFLFGGVFLAGCKSNSTGPGTNNNTISSGMTATINGHDWKSDAVVGFRYAQTATPNLQFEGWVTQPLVQIPFNVSPAITGPGTYPLVTSVSSLSDMSAEVSLNTDTASFSDNVSGTMTITVLTSNNVQGTFSFKAVSGFNEDTVVVTNGKFNVPLQ